MQLDRYLSLRAMRILDLFRRRDINSSAGGGGGDDTTLDVDEFITILKVPTYLPGYLGIWVSGWGGAGAAPGRREPV